MLDTLELYTRVYGHLVSFDDLLAQYTHRSLIFLKKLKFNHCLFRIKFLQCTKHYIWYINFYLDSIAIAQM